LLVRAPALPPAVAGVSQPVERLGVAEGAGHRAVRSEGADLEGIAPPGKPGEAQALIASRAVDRCS
jgi:hypothetical protein